MTLETIMIGTKGFRTREAAANYRNRNRRLVSEEVRAARFANLHGYVGQPAEQPVKADVETTAEPTEQTEQALVEQTQAEQAEQSEGDVADADNAGDEAGNAEGDGEGEGDSEGDANASDQAAPKKKAPKRAKK